jgi:GT2 family glycosyltransferase
MLDRCLRSLNEQTFAHFEVIVINNGTQGIVLPPNLSYPCRVLPVATNIGFGAAINLAARSSPSPYIATLNDDTEADPQWLEELVFEMAADPRTGMCASRIRLFDLERLDSAGMLICLDGSSRQRGHGQNPTSFGRTADVLLPSACAALYRLRMLEDAGFFDEDFFLYCEDTDLGLRGQWAGWGCRYASGATVRHHYSSTAGAYSPVKALLIERNRIWVAVKNFPLVLLAVSPLMSGWRYFWHFISIIKKRGAAAEFVRSGISFSALLAILLRAWAEAIRVWPLLLRKRAAVRRTRRISSLSFIRLLLRHRITARELAHSG